MADIKPPRLPDRTPVKLVLSLAPDLHARLQDYARFYEAAHGQAVSLAELIPAIAEAFLLSDRDFVKALRAGEIGHV